MIRADASHGQASTEDYLGVKGLAELAAPSSLLSSRWSRDNVVTAHPARLYDGPVAERIGPDLLEYLVEELAKKRGPLKVGAGRMGVVTWDLACEDESGRFVLQVPVALDAPGPQGRAKRDVPRKNVENARHFSARGLGRFVTPPVDSFTLGGVPAALFAALPEHRPVTFGAGAVRVRLADDWLLALGTGATADVLAEMVAALVYHYEPDLDHGTAVSCVFINDADFVLARRADGSLDLRLTALRQRESNVGPNLLLLYLIQLMAYEDFSVNGALTGLPALVSNPSIAFEGLVRGLRYRERDLGHDEEDGVRKARRFIAEFARSREGRAYRPWAERFLEGRLPLRFGDDPREHWWRLFPLERNQRLLELRGRHEPGSTAVDAARQLKSFLARLSREIGRLPEEDPALFRVNDGGGEELAALLAEANVEPGIVADVAREIFAAWPFRNLDQLLARVPRARNLRRLKSRLSFGHAVAPAEEGTLKALGAPPKSFPSRPLANHELFGPLRVPASRAADAVRTFPTFEAYMDTALHHPEWGYYGHAVVIGKAGHFDTHPEELSPDYGAWVAELAFKAWRNMRAHGELAAEEPFPLLEFGAGNGRLARDVLDFIARSADGRARSDEDYRTFAERVEYRIYEMSEALRARQRELLGERAIIAPGDARAPGVTLRSDFPNGFKGFVVTNEVPDAFGVHKVVLAADGRAFAALVVPRVEPELEALLGALWGREVADADAAIRQNFGFEGPRGERYLDRATFGAVLEAVHRLAPNERARALAGVWFEEAYVPVAFVPELARHLAANAGEYASALAAEDSGVVAYVNVHASDFMRELGACVRAGFVVTIDYGETTFGLVQGARRGEFAFRVYGEQEDDVPRPNDPYAFPGSQDLTADVNFTELASAGEAAGLKVVHFGPERDVGGDSLPALLRASTDSPVVTKFVGHPGFKVLVLGTRPSAAFTTPLTTALPLTRREQDVAKMQREKIAEISAILRAFADSEQLTGKF
jgi:SAM-dependent MidA family methyltransferase